MILVPPELKPISWPGFARLVNRYLNDPSVGTHLGRIIDIDYLSSLSKFEDRQFMADFLMEWYRSYLDTHKKRSDIYHQYDLVDIKYATDVSTVVMEIDNLDASVRPKTISMWSRKMMNSYTLRDYMPSPTFNENFIIDAIDHEKAMEKSKHLYKAVKK